MIPSPQEAALMELEALLSPARLAAMDPRDRLLAIAQTGVMGDNAGIAQGPLPAPLAAAVLQRSGRGGSRSGAPPRPLVSNAALWRRGGGGGGGGGRARR
jgi:hypothetical protein